MKKLLILTALLLMSCASNTKVKELESKLDIYIQKNDSLIQAQDSANQAYDNGFYFIINNMKAMYQNQQLLIKEIERMRI